MGIIPFLLTFLAVFVMNLFYSYYIKATQEDKPLLAGCWSAMINLVASLAAIGYIQNHWLLIPSCLGSFIGTWVGVRRNNKTHV